MTFRNLSYGKKLAYGLLGATGVGGAGLVISFERSINAGGADADRFAHPPNFPWAHSGLFSAYDIKSVRRGYEVYKKVCAACHSCKTVAYRMLAETIMTTEEAKAEAKRAMFQDGPDDKGEMFERPGKLTDRLPEPYPNKEAAAYANGGKAPPDLGLITFARHGRENYIFSLLTGYTDAPAGYVVDEGLYFNPYFRGGAISMPPPIYDGVLEYHDGTPATKSQVAKDVSCFLRFAAEPWHDERKKLSLKILSLLAICTMASVFYNRHFWQTQWTQRLMYVKKQGTTVVKPKYT